jgi:hypothetical protein
MSGFEFATNQVALPAWAAGAAVALLVVVGMLTLTRAGASVAGAVLRVAVVAGVCASVWMLLEQGALRDRAAEQRALDQRAADLAMRAAAPGSALACLDAVAGEVVETACEKQVFASPQSVAAAVSYVSARLVLLADAVDFARRGGARHEASLSAMRLALEADRFGFVAHVLSVRDSCTPLLCDSYVLFKDPDRVQANLRERLFDRYVERYAPEWARPQPTAPGVAAATPGAAAGVYTTASAPPPAAPLPSKFDFPSAASIPPVSIMTPEPSTPPGAPPEPKASTAATVPMPPPAPRRSLHPLHPRARAATAAPQQIVPTPAATNPAPH